MKKKSGVSLITLIITIIVMIILAGTVITTLLNNNVVERADEATFKSDISSYKEELSMYILNRILEDNMYDSSSLNADKDSGTEILNSTNNSLSGIKAVIKSMKAADTEIFIIKNGKLMIAENATSQEKEWADNSGIDAELTEYGKNDNTGTGVASVNRPVLTKGLTPIVFDSNGKAKTTKETDPDWYAYIDQGNYLTDGKTSKWANAMSQDGSQWVWIPRYAYKIVTPGTDTASEIKVVFIDINNRDEDGNDYTNGYDNYVVHPAFTSDVSKGGWDKELTGIWIAKYEAGFGGINNIDSNGTSSITYASNDSNALGTVTANLTKMTYPVFKPNAYSYNYVNTGDSYAISRALTETNNPYGFTKSANSHMIKNSEWRAAAYLAQSKYGRNGIEVTINNKILNNNPNTVYTITGYSNGENYTYNTTEGMLASTTGNIYGIYDMSGGATERTAGYINNGSTNLLSQGKKMVDENNTGTVNSVSNKFISVYPIGISDTKENNYNATSIREGELIGETSGTGDNSTSWFEDYSIFPSENAPFLSLGGYCDSAQNAGIFNFNATYGRCTILS